MVVWNVELATFLTRSLEVMQKATNTIVVFGYLSDRQLPDRSWSEGQERVARYYSR